MFKINMVLHAIYVRHFPIIMSGVEDNVENYQSYLDAYWCSSPMKSIFFSFCHSHLDLSHDFHAQICFHSYFFTVHTHLGCRKCLIGMQFERMADKLLSRTLCCC